MEGKIRTVLDVSSTRVVHIFARELVQDGFDGLSDDVGEDVETTTMGHANNDGFDTLVDGAVDERLHAGNERLAAFETETLLVRVLAGDELFEQLGPHESIKNHALLFRGVVPWLGDFDSLSNPVALVLAWDVDVFDTDSAA